MCFSLKTNQTNQNKKKISEQFSENAKSSNNFQFGKQILGECPIALRTRWVSFCDSYYNFTMVLEKTMTNNVLIQQEHNKTYSIT